MTALENTRQLDQPTLVSTVQPGDQFGRFNLPMTPLELVWQLAHGTPCQIPRVGLVAARRLVEHCFDPADIQVEVDSRIAQLTPLNLVLTEAGRTFLADSRRALKMAQIQKPISAGSRLGSRGT